MDTTIPPRDETPEQHPLRERPDLPLELRVDYYREQAARLWDMVWWIWLGLTEPERKALYERQGFTAPIEQFYEEIEE